MGSSSVIKSCNGDELCWYKSAPSAFWAERVTLHKATGLSPYFMAHGVEPLFPFDLAQVTFLVPPPESDSLNTTALITFHTCQLQKRCEDIDSICEKVLKSCFQSIKQFEQTFKNHIKDYNFVPGSLVLIRNTQVKKELNRKTKPCYLGSMLVIRRIKGGLYMLAELDGSISKLHYVAF
ncbi:hypothetical protein PAXINDRAFT_90381 [Paxillus involutus ATCC 200175]|uniref:Uncharacterized protein n=1 Tax=Paxillus involutus ATCC 200175 TaxID=664439 RepID=A0A0C9T8G8_PAXIN|nr:hypothetical protein PAXINDRAFT_90381 [Paxillus involutus ATCC 200175]